MTDRVIRDEIFDSDRWLDLPGDTCRLAYFGFLLKRIDDYGNMEGGMRSILRFVNSFTEVHTIEATQALMAALEREDMVRPYAVGGREYYHLPRLRTPKKYLTRDFPPSPWDDTRPTGKELRQRRSVRESEGNGATSGQESEKNQWMPPEISEQLGNVIHGVGVGVNGVDVDLLSDLHSKQSQNLSGVAPLPAAGKTIPTWNAYSDAYEHRYRVKPIRNRSVNDQLAAFIARVGANDAPAIAAYFLGSNRGLYVSAKHATTLLLRDAEALRTEWLTQSHGTDSEARIADQTQARGNVFTKLIAEAEREEGNEGTGTGNRRNG